MSNRICYWINSLDEDNGEIVPCVVEENRAGYNRVNYVWNCTKAEAVELVDGMNIRMGLTKRDVDVIVASSMRAQNQARPSSGIGDALSSQATIAITLNEPGDSNQTFLTAEISFYDGNHTAILDSSDNDIESLSNPDAKEFIERWKDIANDHGMLFDVTDDVTVWLEENEANNE